MNQSKTIRLLILNDSRSEAERLISMLNNAGRPSRAQHVDNLEALNKLLSEGTWDLMIAMDSSVKLSPLDAIKQIRRLNRDVPVILQSESGEPHHVVEGLKIGAMDVIKTDEDQHLLMVIQRELEARNERNQRRFAERRYSEIEKRNQQLLDSSRDAIAFIQDGMFLYANESFAELLNYESRDDIECMPVIDMIKEDHQTKVKKFLKEFTIKGSEIETETLEFVALGGDDKEKNLKVEVKKSNYDEEACIQFLIGSSVADSEELEAQLEQIKNQDMATGLYNKNYLIEKLEKSVDNAMNGSFDSALFHIGIENLMNTVTKKLGITATDVVLNNIASYTQSLVKKDDTLCRFSEDSFILLVPKIDSGTALVRAEKLCMALRDHIVDIDGTTLQFSFAVGVSLINNTSHNSDEPIDHAIKALDLARKKMDLDKDACVSIFEPEATKDSTKKNIANMVQKALDHGRFKLLFQPILSLRGSDKEHYEVLLRMVDESTGEEISPDEFLKTAAKIGSTTKIDRWVILESVKLLSEHRSKGHNTRLIVNLSRESMLDSTLLPWLTVAFKAAKLPPDTMLFQMNEVDVNDHLNVAATFTEDLAKLGCESSISRFGCALNPFNALKNVKSNYIKVDGSFTQDLQSNGDDGNSLNDLVSQLHEEEKITIVPFVENANVLSKLWQSGVHYIQGFYLQGPAESMDYDFDMES